MEQTTGSDKQVTFIDENEATFKLGKRDVAFIIRDEGQMELILPKFEDDEQIPGHVLFMTAISLRITNQEWTEDQLDWLDEALEKSKKENDE